MVLMDPAEEIRRLVEDEEIPRDEARARVREDLRKRQAVQSKGVGPASKKPLNLQWTPAARKASLATMDRVAANGSRRRRSPALLHFRRFLAHFYNTIDRQEL